VQASIRGAMSSGRRGPVTREQDDALDNRIAGPHPPSDRSLAAPFLRDRRRVAIALNSSREELFLLAHGARMRP
jgi:hypothetical protein